MVSANGPKTPEGSNQNALTSKLEALGPGEHLCCLFETEEEHRAVLTPFLRHGLERGEKVLYIVDAHTAGAVLGYLRDAGVAVEPFLASGQMSILTPDDAYMRGGVFDPDAMIGILRDETDRAVAQGYRALRVTGEMSWALRGLPGAEKLIEYESKLNEFFPGSKCLAICQYDRRRFGAEVLLDVLTTHPLAIVGGTVHDNFYYVPPQEFLGPDRPGATLQHWLQNLADRRRREEALRESEERLRTVFEAAKNVAFVTTDLDGAEARILDFSPGAEAIFGYSREEVIGKPLAILHVPEDVGYFRQVTETMRRRRTSLTAELELARKSGEKFPALVSTLPILDAHGNMIKILGVSLDITERKQVEAERERLIAELEATNAELERFTYTVSHELKSPLITIRGFLGQLAQDAATGNDERLKDDIARITNAAKRMQELLDELLELSRIGRVVGPPERVPLAELAREAAEMLSGAIENRRVQVEIAPDLPVVFGDPRRLREVLQGLIENAVKFMGHQPEPRVEIGWRKDGAETVCYVRDNGIGIDPRYHNRVFRLFEQLDNTQEGTGVGLAVAERIVKVHGGRLWVESEGPGRGSTFCFVMPINGRQKG